MGYFIMNIQNEDFVHLHVHSEYSFPSGMCRIKNFIQQLKDSGQKAAAITDNGTLYSAVLFYQEAIKADIKPIIGCEIFCTEPEQKLILLCENQQGYQNLIKLVSSEKPVDSALLRKYHQGLICLSSAENAQKALYFQNLFGVGNYFLEVSRHGLQNEKLKNQILIDISKETNIPLTATNQVYYLNRSDAPAQKLLTCIRMNQTPDELTRSGKALPNAEYYLKSAQEMQTLFSDIPEAILNTKKIADRCHLKLTFHELKLPHFVQEGITDNTAYLRKLCEQGMYQHYGANPSQEVRERLDYELNVIQKMGFTDYFLIVQDFVRYAKNQEIPVGAGRGSAAGSLCAYCLHITEIDPIRENLLFERFLNAGRQSMPDIDIDFCMEGRSKVKDYVIRRYGQTHTAEIVAFDTLKAKAVVRDTARILKLSSDLTEKIISRLDSSLTIQQALEQSPELSQLYQQEAQVQHLLDMASQLENLPRHTTIHAAGIVITEKPVSDYVPVFRNETTLVTQYSAPILEELGLLKMDFLGLRNLTIIRDAEKTIKKNDTGFSIRNIPLDDAQTCQLIAEGRTSGVFQLESEGMKSFLKKMKPRSIQDIMTALAIYRPGAMPSIPDYLENRQHPERIRYAHPALKEILEPTYGCLLYQEQVMQICRKLAGYSYAEADNVRRAMSKKKPEIMRKEKENFIQGALKHNIPEQTAIEIFSRMERFAEYAFNKSHAAAYARIAYQTAYLKTHYFGEYMASLMTSVISGNERLAPYLEECKNTGLIICPPDVNVSEWNFVYQNQKLYFGLLAVKGLGRGFIDKMLSERRKNGKFLRFSDFCERMSNHGLYKKTLESMIQAGALDSLGCNRKQMLTYDEQILNTDSFQSQTVIDGQMSLFGETDADHDFKIPPMEDFSLLEKLQMEKQATGFYFSGHPLEAFAWLKNLLHCQSISTLETLSANQPVKLLCMIQSCKKFRTKQNAEMCFLKLEDISGQTDAVLFPEVYASVRSHLQNGQILFLTGKISDKNQKRSLIAEQIFIQQNFPAMLNQMLLCLKVTHANQDLQMLRQLPALCEQFQGSSKLILYFMDSRNYAYPKHKLTISVSEASYQALKKIISPEKIGCISGIKS